MSNSHKTSRLKLVPDGGAIPRQGSERKRRRLAGTIVDLLPDRPRLPLQADTAAVFDSPAWQTKWRAIKTQAATTSIYIAGCSGTIVLGNRLGVPVVKPGTAGDVDHRMRQLNQQRYGSLVVDDLAMIEETGFTDWEPSKLSARPTHPASPVRVLPRALLVTHPVCLTSQDLEALFVASVQSVALTALAMSAAGQGLRERCGGPDALLRYYRTSRGLALATEIACMGPSADTGRLISIIEWIVIRIVLGQEG